MIYLQHIEYKVSTRRGSIVCLYIPTTILVIWTDRHTSICHVLRIIIQIKVVDVRFMQGNLKYYIYEYEYELIMVTTIIRSLFYRSSFRSYR
jgi:hypothetical protein